MQGYLLQLLYLQKPIMAGLIMYFYDMQADGYRAQMADLFERDVKTIGKHINNALNEELQGDN